MLPLYRVTALTLDGRSVTHFVRVDMFEADETTPHTYYRAICPGLRAQGGKAFTAIGSIDKLITQAGLIDPEIEPDDKVGGTNPLAKTAGQIWADLHRSMGDLSQILDRSNEQRRRNWPGISTLQQDDPTRSLVLREQASGLHMQRALNRLRQAAASVVQAIQLESESLSRNCGATLAGIVANGEPDPEAADSSPGMGV